MDIQKSYRDSVLGKVYLVPTPIGNLEDMTFRAVKTLKSVAVIASEDTRNTQKLLNHFDIPTSQISFHEHNVQSRLPQFLAMLQEGQSIAQVSDAGMPSISDPGYELVQMCVAHQIDVIALPGATAGLTALIASGLAPQPHTFYGFLPRKKKEQKEFLETIKNQQATAIFYESPYRIKETVSHCADVLGEDRPAVVCRELTKIHEEYLRGTLAELQEYLAQTAVKGECCLLISGADEATQLQEEAAKWQTWSIQEHVDYLKETEQLSSNEAIKKVAKLRSEKKQEIYKQYHQ